MTIDSASEDTSIHTYIQSRVHVKSVTSLPPPLSLSFAREQKIIRTCHRGMRRRRRLRRRVRFAVACIYTASACVRIGRREKEKEREMIFFALAAEIAVVQCRAEAPYGGAVLERVVFSTLASSVHEAAILSEFRVVRSRLWMRKEWGGGYILV